MTLTMTVTFGEGRGTELIMYFTSLAGANTVTTYLKPTFRNNLWRFDFDFDVKTLRRTYLGSQSLNS
jgi:hypothetical protein